MDQSVSGVGAYHVRLGEDVVRELDGSRSRRQTAPKQYTGARPQRIKPQDTYTLKERTEMEDFTISSLRRSKCLFPVPETKPAFGRGIECIDSPVGT